MASSDEGLRNVTILAIFSGFIAGFAAYYFIKKRRFESGDRGFFNTIMIESLICAGVTIAMVIGSFCGAFIMGFDLRDLANTIQDYALSFFFKIFIAMLWGVLLKSKFGRFGWALIITYWTGLFFVYIIYDTFAYYPFTIFLSTLPDSLSDIPIHLSSNFEYVAKSTIYIVTNPWTYIKDVFAHSQGNQFIIVGEFPKWTLILLSVACIAAPFHLFKGTGGK